MASAHNLNRHPDGIAADWTMPQNWHAFTDEDHFIWDSLVRRQRQVIGTNASRRFLDGLDILDDGQSGIPRLESLNARLMAATGWEVVAVPGVVPNDIFFRHLSERRFPAANFLRPANSLDYSDEPDMFHDLFGHVPLLTDSSFAEFMVAYGKAGISAEKMGASDLLARLYLYTVEFGLVREGSELKAYGAGLLSSYSELLHAVNSPTARRLHLDLPRVMQTDYLFDEFQQLYFAVDSLEHLLQVTEETDFAAIYSHLRELPSLKPDASIPEDRHYVLSVPQDNIDATHDLPARRVG